MKKIFCIIICLVLFFNLSGCASIGSEKNENIIPPKISSISIEGRWEISNEVNNEKSENTIVGQKIGISSNKFVFRGIAYNEVVYKIKYVDIENYIQFQYKIDIKSDEIDMNGNMKVIGVYNNSKDKNKIICEFIEVDDSKMYMIYNEKLYELNKIDSNKESIDEYIDYSKTSEDSNEGDRYNSPTGVLIGLKTNRNDSYEYEPVKYSTVWINFDNGDIKYIDNKENILIPRSKNFWSLKVETNETDEGTYEKIITMPVGEKNINIEQKGWLSQYPIDYSEIEFVGNDYIGIKHSSGDNTDSMISRYGIRTIEKPNLPEQLTVDNIYGEEGKKQFEIAKNLAEERAKDKSFKAESSNLRMERDKGRWVLKGYLVSEKVNEIKEFNINSLSTSKLVNYDTLHVSWKKMIEKNKNTIDLITSPNRRYAISLADGYLYIYEMKNGDISSLISRFPVGNGKSIIMAEWASGDFVANWDKVFKEDFN